MPIDAPVRQTNDQTANQCHEDLRMFSMIALSTERKERETETYKLSVQS
jgi:hypothetical protein